jgi:hypothetical protein
MALGDWTGPDRDHDYFESRASEQRPLGDREGIRPRRPQDDSRADQPGGGDGGCLEVSPNGTTCIRPAGHDLVGNGIFTWPHRDVSNQEWDDDGLIASPFEQA